MIAFAQLRSRLGDFWWYTALQFGAARCGDFINAFIGLWLVPKYVGMEELGAVLPLAYFATFLAMPIAVFSTALSKQVNVLVAHGQWGQLKTLLRGIFTAAAIFVVFALLAVRFFMPVVLERVRVEKGALGLVIVAASLLGTVAPIYLNALQATKRFVAVSVINLFCAPIRLVVMLVAMPIRALTGYFVGQSSAPAFQIVASVFAFRKELGRSVKAEPFWTKVKVLEMFGYMLWVAIAMAVGGLVQFVEPLVIRQRLPDLDSAAYYMISRFAEIGTYLGLTLSTIVFPYVSEAAESGRTGNRLIVRSMVGSLAFGGLCAVGFAFFGHFVFPLLPNGDAYGKYIPELVVLTLILSVGIAVGCFTSGETAANRFKWLWWFVPLHVVYVATLFVLTGHGYLQGILPASICEAIASVNACRLDFLLGLMGGFAVLKLVCVAVQLWACKNALKA